MTEELEKVKIQSELAERLERVRAERARLAEERQRRETERELLERVEAEELALQDEQVIAKAEDDHGPLGKRIAAVHTRSGVVIVKRPNPVLWKRFVDASKQTADELERLVRPCVVHPDKASFDRYLEEEPALLVRCADHVATLAGVRMGEVSGK